MNNSPGESDILAQLAIILSDFGGREFSGEIGPDTMFFGDLGLASIDAIVLGETLEAHYARPLPFAGLMAELGTRAERDLSLGELAAYVNNHW